MGAAAGGIAAAGPVVTTFNVPAAAALTSRVLLHRREDHHSQGVPVGRPLRSRLLLDPSTNDFPELRAACWQVQVQATNAFIVQTSSITQNSPITISRGPLCAAADEGIFQVTAEYAGLGTCVGGPADDGTVSFTQSTATVTTGGAQTITRSSSLRAAENRSVGCRCVRRS